MLKRLATALSGGISTNDWCEVECPCGQYTKCIPTAIGTKYCSCVKIGQ